jgi:hypothetical protein
LVKPSSAAEHVKPPSPFESSPLSVSDLIPPVTRNAFSVPTMPESYSRMVTGWLTVGGLEAVLSEIKEVAGTMTSASLGCFIRQEHKSPSVPGDIPVLAYSGRGSTVLGEKFSSAEKLSPERSSGSPGCLLQPETSSSPPLPESSLPAVSGVILGLSSSGGGPSCQHVDPDGDVGSGLTEIQPETLSEISLGSESRVDEKLTSEWELDVWKKAAGIWEMLSQEFA